MIMIYENNYHINIHDIYEYKLSNTLTVNISIILIIYIMIIIMLLN